MIGNSLEVSNFNWLHPKFRNTNLHNVTLSFEYLKTLGNGCSLFISHSLLSHFFPLYHENFHKCKPPKKSTHTLVLCCFKIHTLSQFTFGAPSKQIPLLLQLVIKGSWPYSGHY